MVNSDLPRPSEIEVVPSFYSFSRFKGNVRVSAPFLRISVVANVSVMQSSKF